MSLEARVAIQMLDRYDGKVVPVRGRLYVTGKGEMLLADDDLCVKHLIVIRLIDGAVERLAETLRRHVPPWGGGPFVNIVDATVRGKLTRARDTESKAMLTELEEVDIREDWFTARIRLKDVE